MADINLLPVPISAGDVISLDGADIQARRVTTTHRCRATLTTDISNATGNGTFATIIFNTEIYDPEGIYNVANGVITPAISGVYHLDAFVTLSGGSVISNTALRLYDIGNTTVMAVANFPSVNFPSGVCQLSTEVSLVFGDTYRLETAGFGEASDLLEIEEGSTTFGAPRTWFNLRLVG